MPGPARAGLFIFPIDFEPVSELCESVAGMTRLYKTDELMVIESPDIQLLIHKSSIN